MCPTRFVLGCSLVLSAACMDQGFVHPSDPAGQVGDPRPVIRLDPEQWDFGAPLVGCPAEQPVRIWNDGDADLVVHALELTGSSEFSWAGSVLPLTLAPGGSMALAVGYLPADTEEDSGELVAGSNDPERPEATATAVGLGAGLASAVEVFTEPDAVRTDVLVVVDNSASMAEEQANLTGNFQAFLTEVARADADWRIAVITTDDPRFRGPILSPATPDPVGEFTRQALAGIGGSADEAPMQMVSLAVSPGGDAAPGGAFFRDDAMLSVIVVTDEPDDVSPMFPVELANQLLALKGHDASLVRFHTIGSDVPVPACASAILPSIPLDDVVILLGGLFLSVCGDWGTSLSAVAQSSVTLEDTFPLADDPVTASITVTVDGAGVATGWRYDAVDRAVVFDAGAVPGPGAEIEIAYALAADCAG